MAGKHIKFDWAIKRLLRNKANFEILEGFLSELLMFDIKIQEILESESNQQNNNEKYNRVDILVKDLEDNFMLIEVQNERQDDYFHRMLYGQAKLISERLNIGEEYGKLTKVYSINIVYFPLGVGKDYIYVSDGSFKGLHEHDTLELSDKQKKLYNAQQVKDLFTQYYIIKVNAFNKNAKAPLDQWIHFLKTNEIKDNFKAKGLEKAKEVLRVDNLSHDEKIAYDIYVKKQRIHQSEITTALTDVEYKYEAKIKEERRQKEEAKAREKEERRQKEEAKAREKEERRQKEEAKAREKEAKAREEVAKAREKETKINFAKKMLEYGEPIATIIEATGLKEEDIKKLM